MIKAEVIFDKDMIIVGKYQIDICEECCTVHCRVYWLGATMGRDNILFNTELLEQAIKYCMEN